MKYLLILALIISVSCNDTKVRKVEKEKTNYKKIVKTSNSFKNKSLEFEMVDFIKEHPKRIENIETYYISFYIKNNDTIITIQKGLYVEYFGFINQDNEYKGWFEYNGNFINIVDRKINPIGKNMLDYTLLSKNKIKNKKVVEYHGQKKLHQLMVDKQYILKEGILKKVSDKNRIYFFD